MRNALRGILRNDHLFVNYLLILSYLAFTGFAAVTLKIHLPRQAYLARRYRRKF